MLVETKDFGPLNINEDDIIFFPTGIYGFEELHKFVILTDPVNKWIIYLQSLENAEFRFLMLDPYSFFEKYNPIISEDVLNSINPYKREDIVLFSIVVIPSNTSESTVNLKSPILINFNNKTGMQIILENKDYNVATKLFSRKQSGG